MKSIQNVVVIGSGKLAGHLVPYLHYSGIRILQIMGRTAGSAKPLADSVGAQFIIDSTKIDAKAECALLLVNDDAIGSVSQELSSILSNQCLMIHCSGSQRPDIISSFFEHRAVLWPLMSFNPGVLIPWEQVPFFIQGDQYAIDVILRTTQHLGLSTYLADQKTMSSVHLAAVFSNNFSNFNLIISEMILKKTGIPLEVLQPIMMQMVQKAFEAGPENTQTGPARRGDRQIVEKQHSFLEEEIPEAADLYLKISKSIIQHFNSKK
ncbi:MAG: DUF2520 domain-containing protein [Saprospiraceae bacterium]|nr:DUF2520 domain-containing protein [Saprospiraceae bacterium]HMW39121.1 DUF2520 domain-containing protein [Saprospiraceae bacterium]HMX89603.1 DUF2520 domain-containing protein [Saprospiraceae bacterium]HMZ41116.1 DUF2520 domain-containing protein [Saprospiraceae bacterium]HNA65533.1 DUF2520 domain-containing protein [Saprospiraceae bacterium]